MVKFGIRNSKFGIVPRPTRESETPAEGESGDIHPPQPSSVGWTTR